MIDLDAIHPGDDVTIADDRGERVTLRVAYVGARLVAEGFGRNSLVLAIANRNGRLRAVPGVTFVAHQPTLDWT